MFGKLSCLKVEISLPFSYAITHAVLEFSGETFCTIESLGITKPAENLGGRELANLGGIA